MNEEKYRAQIIQPNEIFNKDLRFVSFAKEAIKNDLIAKLSEIITEDAPKLVTLSKPTMREIQPWNETVMRQDIVIRDLVFCKDCKYWHSLASLNHKRGELYLGYCDVNNELPWYQDNIETTPDDFCSKGERKETDDGNLF